MIFLRLLSHRPDRREWLESVLSADPELKVVCGGVDSYDLAKDTKSGADVIVIDLDHPYADESRFWAALHVYFPGARFMVLAAAPIDSSRLEAALHAGAIYMVEWCEPVERMWRAAHAARLGEGFIPLGNVLLAICEYYGEHGTQIGDIRLGDLCLHPQRGVIELGTQEIPLTKLEQDLLLYLAANAGRPIPTGELLRAVWRQSSRSSQLSDQVKSTIKRLRRKLEPDPNHPKYLLNRQSHGYFVPKTMVDLVLR